MSTTIENQKPWKVEYAKSSRSSCKTCKFPIDKETLRLGKMIQAKQFDGLMPMWNHATCVMKNSKQQIKSIDDVEGIEQIRWGDQQRIRKYVEDRSVSEPQKEEGPKLVESGIEVSSTSRATCRQCSQKILKGEVRLSTKTEGQGPRGSAWHHAKCYMEFSPKTQLKKLSGWDTIPESDQEALGSLVKEDPDTGKSGEAQEEGGSAQKPSKAGAKRKKNEPGGQKSKAAKSEGDVSAGVAKSSAGKATQDSSQDDIDVKLELQSKQLWALKDELKKHVATAELREMLEANGQDSSGSELDLRDRCADGMLFGALSSCPLCSSSLRYSSGMYRCQGYLSAWSKCSFSSTEPQRVKGKWKIPEDTENTYLSKWFKSQKAAKPARIVPPQNASGNQASQSSVNETLTDLKVAISGLSKEAIEEWKTKINSAGGSFHDKIKKDTNCLVLSGSNDDHLTEIKKAKRMKIPIVREDYLEACFRKQKKLPFDLYKYETAGEASGTVTVRVKGQSAVHELSGLQDSGHILEDGKSIYNTTLSMSDLSTGINSYYILQIIQEDKSSTCYVFRKWGRVGNEKIGGNKLENLSKSDAIAEFKRLFLEKTGNPWEAWERKENFEKQPGRFFPLDIDYGVNKNVTKKERRNEVSKLASPIEELMKMLFNEETYRAAMMEFEINLAEMPLGKLSKNNIQKGFEALTEIQNLLNANNHDPSLRESLIVDASNRFFTVIPSVHPRVIRDEEDFKSKVKMLEALKDIEIASKVIGFDVDDDETLDDKYKKLNCDILPLDHDSSDFKLIEKYLLTTHAPTHKDWTLELEEVFAVERAGEYDSFKPYREKLGNKMLLWHGSRLTNYVGILSQGLRIAPPEAPTTGYMFGKGIYFADLVSKSAQYCYTDKKNPIGLLLLSEVALGEVYELKKAEYMEKPPKGKHSTKGLGKKVPQASEYVKWKDDVVVPSGKPVNSNVRASELMYNEYIVYNTAQVKMQYMLKVKFQHKR